MVCQCVGVATAAPVVCRTGGSVSVSVCQCRDGCASCRPSDRWQCRCVRVSVSRRLRQLCFRPVAVSQCVDVATAAPVVVHPNGGSVGVSESQCRDGCANCVSDRCQYVSVSVSRRLRQLSSFRTLCVSVCQSVSVATAAPVVCLNGGSVSVSLCQCRDGCARCRASERRQCRCVRVSVSRRLHQLYISER